MADIEATDADRETFRDRLKEAIAEAGTTAKALEEDLDLARGTFTRVYGGRKQLDTELLTLTAERVGVDPADLVEGTSFEALLPGAAAPEAPAPATSPVEAEVEEPLQPPETEVVEEPIVDTEVGEAHPEDVEASVDEVEAVVEPARAEEAEAAAEEAEAPREAPADEERARQTREPERTEEKARKTRLVDVPIRAAVAIAGGLALVGGTIAALIRRK